MLGFELSFPHTEWVPIGILLALVGVVLLGITYVLDAFDKRRTRREDPPVAHFPLDADPDAETTGPVVVLARTITWPTLVDAGAGDLTEPERRHVIDGLSIVGDAWCAQILARAFDEEEGDLRVAAIEALGRCEGDLVPPTLERAYASYAVAERYAAVGGASRRADVGLLERALRDTDGTVALAAAYGLHRAKRDDVIAHNLAGRDDSRANEIRKILPMLAGT